MHSAFPRKLLGNFSKVLSGLLTTLIPFCMREEGGFTGALLRWTLAILLAFIPFTLSSRALGGLGNWLFPIVKGKVRNRKPGQHAGSLKFPPWAGRLQLTASFIGMGLVHCTCLAWVLFLQMWSERKEERGVECVNEWTGCSWQRIWGWVILWSTNIGLGSKEALHTCLEIELQGKEACSRLSTYLFIES